MNWLQCSTITSTNNQLLNAKPDQNDRAFLFLFWNADDADYHD